MIQVQLPQTSSRLFHTESVCSFPPYSLSSEPPTCRQHLSGTSPVSSECKGSVGPAMSSVHGALQMSSHHNFHAHDHMGMDQRHLNPAAYHPTHLSHLQPQPPSQASSRTTSRPASPVFQQASLPDPASRAKLGSSTSVASYLQLPPTISHGKPGSLAEFAAQITCLFWFETTATLGSIEEASQVPTPAAPLGQEAIPVTGFLKWVTTILTTTQVTQNVVILALSFIYRLKKQNPLVKGKPGSEYRLLTVALMLGNKFLDDNTYTNKTWAEVSGISVHEIHVMEVEFLSHMKYNLFTSKEEWDDWHHQLGKFWLYFDRAARKSAELATRQSSMYRATPLQIPHALPSPPSSITASPPYGVSASPTSFAYSASSASLPYNPPVNLSPVGSASEYENGSLGRKRSWDQSILLEPQPKRQHTHAQYPAQPPTNFYPQVSQQGPLPSLPSLPIPNLPMPMPTNQQPYQSQMPGQVQSQPSFQTDRSTPGPFLPPPNWLSAVFPQGNGANSFSANAPAGNYANRAMQVDMPSRHHTPGAMSMTSNTSYEGSMSISTPSGTYPSLASHMTNQAQLSPSHFLSKRTSPYRPVRNISTLLVPPPSNQMSHYPASISYDQMQWQPLSKNPNEYDRRTGRVPYLHRDAWPQTNQFEQFPPQYAMN